jgi:mono/diheme cytochrome c family protein
VRRVLLLALLVALPVFVAACGGGEEKNTAPETVVGSVPTGGETGGGGSAGDPVAGKPVFTENCGSCHTLADAGTTGTLGPDLDSLAPDEATVNAQVTNGGGSMPAFGGTLSEQQIADVSAYVAQAAGS